MNYTINIIEFHRPIEDISYDYENLPDIDKYKLSNIDIKASFDYEDNYLNYKIYLLIAPEELKIYKKILDINLIPYLCRDITENVLQNKIDLEKYLMKWITPKNKESYHKFISNIKDWLISNLDLDTILDMINDKGLKALLPIHKEFLKRI